jgi:hypothetical protein
MYIYMATSSTGLRTRVCYPARRIVLVVLVDKHIRSEVTLLVVVACALPPAGKRLGCLPGRIRPGPERLASAGSFYVAPRDGVRKIKATTSGRSEICLRS